MVASWIDRLHLAVRAAGVLAVLGAPAGVASAPAATEADCVIRLKAGVHIVGHRSALQPNVCEYLGIPYGLATTGNRRFAPPEPAVLTGDFVADRYSADCPQNPAKLFAYPNATPQYAQVFTSFSSTTETKHEQSEDCLTLNIWTPARPAHTCAADPVMMWLHGGRHNSGYTNTPLYSGANAAARDHAVVVTFNFRMNIFGFPGVPGGTQNLGFLDHYLAVKWVKTNIKRFGGAPDGITLLGQSSGAVAVSNWAYAFKDAPLVAATVCHSGNHHSFPANTLAQANAHWSLVSNAVGCGSTASNPDTLACMRGANITFQAILDAVKTVPSVPGNSLARSQPPFQATIDSTTFFTPTEYLTRARAGDLARVPFLQMNGNHESGFYRISALSLGNSLPESDWQKFERESFTCAAAAEASYRRKLGITTYRARYMADWESTRLYENPTSGAYHGVDISLWLGNMAQVSSVPPAPAQIGLSARVGTKWMAYAKDPVNGLARSGWPKFGDAPSSLARIGDGNQDQIELVDPALYDAGCAADNLPYWDSSMM